MTAQPATQAPPRHESHEDWAARVMAQAGPPPQHVIDRVTRMALHARARRGT